MSKATTISKDVAIATIVDVLRLRAETQRDEIAYRFLADGEEERGTLTYGELYSRARQIAAELQKHSAVGQRALILDSSEADYIVTFFGCLCAGVIAVPIYAPRVNKKGNARVESVLADAQPSVVLTAGVGSPAVREVITASAGEHVKWIDTNALPADGGELWTPPAITGTDIAFLQYTSGSTATPKGVMVSHANILHNEGMIEKAFDTKPGSVIVGWLPLFHDMGLIGNVLQPLYAGVPCILMSPVAFLQRPLRWLQAISRYRATTSGGPNFAYELCMRKVRPEDLSGLDLSSWRVAFNGAEPVRLDTLNRFAAQFAGCGFRREAFVPCYGLAEATLFVSGGLDPNGVTTANHGANGNSSNGGSGNGAKVSQKQGKLLVASGRAPGEQAVRIVSPDSLQPCSAGDVGEIWISGPSVAQGYWRKEKETEETFNARIPGSEEGPFLRTGDLGFLKDGHLFITGRLKDLLIIRGQNYYPQDIELTVEQSHPILQPGSGAAFSVEIEGEERLVVVQEVAVRKDPESIVQSDLDELDALIKLISRNIVAGHELQAFAIVLIRKGTIPKTSSGKIQRHACRDAFLNRELYVLREWQERKQLEPALQKPSKPELDGHGPHGLASWVAQEISRTQGIDQERVDLNQPFAAYGLDSLAAIEFAHKLQAEFQVEVDVAEFFGDSTITEVIRRATKNTQSPVRKVEKEQPAAYPLSYGQRALWFVHQTAPESAAYNIARVIRIVASLDVGALRLAFQALVNRHPCLRTTVVETAGEPVQQVAEKVEVCFEYFDAGDWSQVELEKALVQQSQRPFSLTLGPLFRTALYARSEKEYLLHIAVHHLVADYWSLTLLLDEIGKLYQAFAKKDGTHLVPLEYNYADFVEWQREKLSGPAGERLRDYWKSELAGDLPPLSLPADHIRPPVQTFRGASLPFSLDARLTKALKRLGEEQQATLFTTLLAAFQVLLYRLTSQKQVIVGCPIAGRSRAEFANIAGYFVNTVPLRADFQHRQTFTEFLSQVRNRVSKAFAHELYPFPLMVEQLGTARDPAVSPVFQSAFALQQTYGSHSDDFVRFALGQPQAQVTLGGLQLEHVAVEQQTAPFDLTLMAGEGPDGIVGAWEYSSDLFEKATLARWAECFSILLEGIISHPDISVSQLPILSGSQYDQLVEELNRTKVEYDIGQCLHELIEEQVKTKPASTAIVYRETELSYRELDERANQAARYLLRSGVRKEDLVGVCMRRSPEMVVAMLGIWKANAAYVPLDPQYPEERLRFMLEDADAKAVITEESLKERVGGTSATVLSWDGARAQIDKESNEKVGRPVSSLQLAYQMYTSGSSGVPKGVMLTHQNAMSLVAWARQTFTEEEFSGVLASTSICFDMSIYELWATLSCGGTVVLADDIISWWESLQGGRVTNRARLLDTVPSAAAQLIEHGPLPEGVVTINLGGEALKEELVSELWQRGNLKRVINLYGPTETTMCSTWTPVEAGKRVTIGRGIGNTQLYVLDQELELAPWGVVGELYIAGAGVGRGYWGQASLTAERFLPDPYSKTAGDRMYRTGDLVRWNNAGQMEYLGRADQQVKVRGYRVELGEIEASVSRYPAVRESVVVVRESGRDRLLVAYAAPRAGMEINEEQLREYLQEQLPRYMLPSKFVILESLPRTPNGKVDRKALPAPESDAYVTREYVAPVGEVESKLAQIWAEVLNLERVGRHDNFFELGGHSLLATRLVTQLRSAFDAELSLRQLFESPTVEELAEHVKRAGRLATEAAPRIERVSREQTMPLSPQQEQLWFLERITAGSAVYSVPAAVRLKGDLDKLALRLSLEEIVRRHEILRTSFVQVDDKLKQRIHETGKFELVERDLRETANGVATEERINREQKEEATSPFLLSEPTLFRAKLLRVAEQEHILLLTFHHIVFDGWSIGVMVNELGQLYKAYHQGQSSPLPELPIQYADYAVWQRKVMADGEHVDGLEYWKKELKDLSELDLPSDHPRPPVQSFRGTVERWEMSPKVSAAIRKVSQDQGVTLFMTLLAGFQILLARYSGQRDIVIGSPIANRAQPELEALIGFFANTLVLRGDINSKLTVEAVLQHARKVCLGAYAHQGIPFEHLVAELQPERDSSRSPLFQVMFALQNAPASALQMHDVEISMLPPATSGARFDLTLTVDDNPEQLQGMMEYCTDLYDRPTVRRMLDHYQQVLSEMARDPRQLISTIPLLSPAERQQFYAKSQHKCLHELFEQQASLTPNALAVVHRGNSLTYAELNQRANQLGRRLKRLGVGSEELAGILLPRCSELLVAMLGVLKAGAAYVLLDPDDRDQLAYILKDVRPDVIVSEQGLSNKLPSLPGRMVYLDAQWNESSQGRGQNVEARVHPENLAYVTYRSEGTKAAEGVAVQHGTVASLVCWAKSVLSANDLQRVLTLNPPTSDLSILDIYVPLCCGGTVVVVDDSFDGVNLEDGNATLMNVTPSVMRELLGRKAVPPSVRTIMLAGEPVSCGLVRKIHDNCDVKRVLNLYGHPEISLGSTVAELQPGNEDKKVSIGRPVENAQAFVLDEHMEPVPAGIVGELYLSAATSARGYFNQPDLTAERFVPNAFGSGGERLFRTGELARHKANGELELWGRVGHETRIRGHRVELEEVEMALERQPEVLDAVVIVPQTGAAENKLVAYIVPQETGATAGDALERTLRAALRQRLPEYMVPSHWATLARLPLLPDGKLDRSALPAVQPKMEETGSLTWTPTEELVAGVWLSLLGKSDIRRDDNFFVLGGHSLTSIQMLARVEKVLNREIELRAIFEFPVLKDFSAYVDQLTGPAQLATLRPIVPTARDGRLPLSFAQQRLWFLAQMEGGSEAYNVPFGLHLKGDLNRTAFGRALDRILVRHEVLRTTFAFRDGEPVQEIDAIEESSFRLLEHDLRGHNDVEAKLAALRELEAGASFDLAAGPLIRGRLIRLGGKEYVFLVTMHHIVSDGWSMGVLVRELNALYGAFLGGGADPLPELEIQYADYAVWQRQWIEGEILQQQAAYWKTTLAGAPALLELPTDHPRPVEQSYAGAALPVVLEEKLTSGLKGLSRSNGTTLYMTLLAGWAILLMRLSGQQDVVIGSPVANRGRAEIENLVGFFVNTLALRLDLSGSPSVSELIKQTKAQSLAAQRHQDIPFEQVVDLLQPVRSLAHSPLFQVMFSWQNAVESSLELPGLEVLPLPPPHKVAQFDLTLSLEEVGDTIGGVIEYTSALFEAATVHRYIGYFLALLKAMVADDAQTIDRLPMLSEEEREQVLYGWNETKAEYPSGKCVHQLFEERAAQKPDAVAVVFEDQELTYGDLNLRANQLGNYLVKLGVGPEVRVGVCMERSLEMVVGLLGVLKAGGAYVPLDPVYPVDRLTYMVQDAKIEVLLTQSKLQKQLPDYAGRIIELDVDGELIASESGSSFVSVSKVSAENLAYVIYTSGSTGKPKGVTVEHRQVCNQLFWAGAALSLGSADRVLQKASFSFDASILEIFLPLARGAQIIIAKPGGERDVDYLVRLVTKKAVTYVDLVPAMLEQMLEHPRIKQWTSLRVMSAGAEILKPELVRAFYQSMAGELWNTYGPTEATVQSTFIACAAEEGQNVPIGRPIANTQIYILDACTQPVPQGVTGELYIGGAGVARGYLNRPELTAEKFLKNPFTDDPNGRMYRTGDLGRWLADGNIEFVGRNDNQVKIRGFRIELGEIEARLAEHPEVREAVVLAREDTQGEKRLVAYYTVSGMGEAEAASVGAEGLRAHLSAVVPDYMVPAAYVRMERLPLTPNGKLDRKALPMPEQEAYAVRGYEAPVGEMETKLAAVWAEVLKLEKVGRHDNFFDLGGHSMLAVRVVSRLQQVLSVEVAIRDLFAHSELADLARHLQGAAHAELPRIMPAKRDGRLPLSFAQQRLWFLAQMEGGSAAYNIPFGLHLKGDLNRTALRRSLRRILVRHEVLRTTFAFRDGEPVQVIGAVEESSFRLIEHDLRGHHDVEAELAALRELEAGASFDLAAGPLIRGRLIRLAEDEYVLLVTMHHIVSDGWSMGVLASEVNALYGAFLGGKADPLPEWEIQYADYAVWQRQWIEGEILQQQAAYWKTTLAGAPALLELPMDRVRPVQQSYAGATLPVVLEEKLTSGLKGLSRSNGTTLYMTLLAGWAILLMRLSGQQDVVIGSPVANRGRAEIENLIGFFVNTLALRLDLSGSPSVSELLEQTKAQSLAAQRHQDIPFEQVVELLQPVRSLAHSPLFQVMFAWQNAAEANLELPGLEVQPLPFTSHQWAKFDLTLSLEEVGDTISGIIEYTSALFEAATVHHYIGYFLALLKAMVADDTQAIDRLPMLSEEEREQVLYEWNETKAEFPSEKCVHQLFEEQVRRSPQATAVVFEKEELSYGELNARANRLAHYLRELGVQPDERVAICVERGFEMIVGLLAILKAGGGYVPLDPAYPEERLQYMLADSAPILLLTQEHLQGLFGGIRDTVRVLNLSDAAPAWSSQPETNPDRNSVGLTSKHLAYVIYTSGSTGQPKGVMVEHMNVARLFTATAAWFHFNDKDVWSLFHSYAFDFSVWEIWGALLYGGRLVVVSRETARSPQEFYKLICQERVTILNQTPSAFRQLISAQGEHGKAPELRHVIFGGEALDVASLKPWYEQNNGGPAQLINMYGITETTVHVTYRPLEQVDTERRSGNSPIGCRIPDLQVYILDSNREPVPVGVVGEMYVGGAGVARGYLNRPELTAEKFLKNPFTDDPNGRMYRTGDLGRWLADGNIEFVGRNDNQVKIRGFRIELGEIEARLAEHPEVREAVVLAREDTQGEKRLVAYYTVSGMGEAEAASVGAEGLRAHLSAVVPDYMVPAAYVRMERLPLTPNGKLDRKALPMPEQEAYAVRGYEAPVGEMETKLAAVWAEVLKLEKVGRHDNFFDLGGHSLLAVTLIERMRNNGFNVDVLSLFSTPTLAELAATVDVSGSAIEVPPNRIPSGCQAITPAMLPLIELTQEEIDRIVSRVPGGAENVQDIYPLAPLQEGILFHYLLGGEGDPYLLANLVSFDTRAHLDSYLAALQRVIDRHDILRTAVLWEDLTEPVQVVWRHAPLCVEEIKLDSETGDVAEQLYALFDPLHYRIEVREAPLLRVYLSYDRQNDRWLMMMLNHHLADDNTTLKFVLKEIEVHLLGQETSLSTPLPFRNLVAQARLGISREEHEAFFREMLGDVEEPTAPFGLLDVQGDGSGIEEGELALDGALAVRLRGQARRLGVSAASLCHLAWAMVLSKVSGRKDVVFGTVLFGRMQGGEGVGLFINTLPLRIDLGEQSVEAGVHKTHALLADLLRHEHAPLALAQRCSAVPAPAPLFSALLNYRQNASVADALSAEAMKAWEGIRWLRSEGRTNYPLTLSVDDLGEGFLLTAQVEAAPGPMRVCEYMRTALQVLVQALETAPATAVGTLDVLPASERRQVLYEWNDTGVEYRRDKCVHELFEEQVERVPEAVAVVYEDTSVSYRELNERANQLAWRLRELGVGPEARVGLLTERSLEMVVGLLGVLKAGAAYVPLDPDYPSERLSYMLESAQVKVLLTQEHLRELRPPYGGPVLELDGAEERKRIAEHKRWNLDVALMAEHLAYIIYTSGSTGRPKGVMNSHGGLLNRLQWMQEEYRLEPGDVVLQKTPFSFDVSVWEFLWPLMEGAKLVVARPGGHQDPGYLAKLIEERQITTLHFVPSMLAVFLDEERPKQCESIRRVVCSGEALPAELAQRCLASLPWAGLHNLYGPTEAAIDVTYWKCLVEDTRTSVPIGKAIANIRLYVVDEAMNPVPVGVPGELCLGGVGLARGYWGRGDLTAERFVPDGLSGRMGERLYRTGDLVRWLADGNLEYMGRLDQQVKIRGFRIELGEIEAALERHPSVAQSVVLAREDKPGDKRLVAYVVADQEAEEDDSGNKKAGLWISELREHLLGKLPEYMVPTAYVQLKRIPLTPNGKIDRKSLPEPGKDIREQEYVGPRNATEETLCRLWQEVLRRERVGIHDSFFNIGGHSLLAVQVISRIKQAFTVEMPLSVLFAAPTVARMAEHIAAVNEPDRSQSSPVLVNIQPQGSRAPFFCVHAVGGQVISYAELSQELGLEQPFYGLQSPPANYFSESGVSIEQLATLYNQEIRSVQPRGPYLLSGWSMGGLVAWEMAQQLRKEGEIISLLALIDTAPPPKYLESEDRPDEISMLAGFAMDMSRLLGRDPGPLVEQFLQAAEQDQWKMVQETLTSSGVLAPKTAHAEMTALLEIYTRNFHAMNNYSIQTSEQAVVYFRASETPERFSKVWTKWSGGGIQFHSVPGDHFTMLRRPDVRIIAETLQRYISMNSNNELGAVSPEMRSPELIGLESQHTP